MKPLKQLAITPGEPAGIGPDCLLQLAQHTLPFIPVAVADKNLLQQRALTLDLPIRLIDFGAATQAHQAGSLTVYHVPLHQPCIAGSTHVANAAYVIETLQRAVNLCESNCCHAMVTGPVNKHVISQSGLTFSGHTEWLGQRLGVADPTMFFVAPKIRLALVTTHIPLAKVAKAVTPERFKLTIERVYTSLVRQFTVDAPTILIAGLNPHAGEQGVLGQEEQTVLQPVINSLRDQGLNLSDPLSADTLFSQQNLARADAFVSLFHDQGLPVLKALTFGQAVNMTLGLPLIRTSVDHGTALPIAATGQADPSSLMAACKLAHQLSVCEQSHETA